MRRLLPSLRCCAHRRAGGPLLSPPLHTGAAPPPSPLPSISRSVIVCNSGNRGSATFNSTNSRITNSSVEASCKDRSAKLQFSVFTGLGVSQLDVAMGFVRNGSTIAMSRCAAANAYDAVEAFFPSRNPSAGPPHLRLRLRNIPQHVDEAVVVKQRHWASERLRKRHRCVRRHS